MRHNLLWVVALAMIFVACDNDSDIDVKPNHSQNGVGVHVDEFIFEGGSRTKIGQDGTIAWTEGDALGICPRYGTSNVKFVVDLGEEIETDQAPNTAYAVFDGGDWALRKNSSYAAYYPYQHILDFDASHINVSLLGQKQNTMDLGTNANQILSREHLGKYDYMASVYTSTDEDGACNFMMKHLCTVARFVVRSDDSSVPESFSKLTVERTDGGEFVTEAYYSLGDVDAALVPAQTSSTIELDLENIVCQGAGNWISLYMMMAPGDYRGATFKMTLVGQEVSSGTPVSYVKTVNGKNMEAGHGYLYGWTYDPPTP